MNHYSELLYYLKSLGEADHFVNTITQGEFDDVDLNKSNIYPLMHITIGNLDLSETSVVGFSVEVGVFQQRDTNKEIVNDKFFENKNDVDNFNETAASLNRMNLIMNRDFDDNDITATFVSSQKVVDGFKNSLDGWIITCDIVLPNTTISLCP